MSRLPRRRDLLAGIGAAGATWVIGERGALGERGGAQTNDGGALVRLATVEWPPYIGADLPAEGWIGQLVRAAFDRRGLPIAFEYLPWARGLQECRMGRLDGVLPMYRSPQRAEEFHLSQRFPGAPVGFYARTADAWMLQYQPMASLSHLRVGVVRGYLNHEDIDDPTGPWRRDEALSDAQNLVKLAAGRVDLIVIDHLVAQHLLRRDPELAAQVRVVEPPFEIRSTTVGLSRATGRGEALCASLNLGLGSLWADGSARAILQSQGVDASLSMPAYDCPLPEFCR